jgi:hypothetical protein
LAAARIFRHAEQVMKRARVAVQSEIGQRSRGRRNGHCANDAGNGDGDQQLGDREPRLAIVHARDFARTVPTAETGLRSGGRGRYRESTKNRRSIRAFNFGTRSYGFGAGPKISSMVRMLIGPRFKLLILGSMTFRSPTTITASLSG